MPMLKPKVSAKDEIVLKPFLQKMVERFPADYAGAPEKPAASPLPNGSASNWCRAADGAVWLANDRGVVRLADESYFRDNVQYFNAPRYLASDAVTAIFPDESNGVWVWTDAGISHLFYQEMTMAEKAAVYDERVPLRQTRHGFVTDAIFSKEGDFSVVTHESSDNDGLWTAMYAAGACYEYAVTGSESALKRATEATEAVLSLVDVTDIPGYFARSFVTAGEKLPDDGFWITKEGTDVIWKSDTSSDEVVGHFLIYLLAHEFLPDEALKAKIRRIAGEVAGYIVDHDYYFIDVTGRPTLWGNWNLDYINGRGYEDTALNAAELLSHIKVAAYLTGDPRFEAEYQKLVQLGYVDLCCEYLSRKEPTINYSDEELCYLTYLPLILLETDPALRAKYKEGMGQWWQNIQRELNPLWTYIYKLIDPELDYDMEGCLWTLRRLPLDLRKFAPNNAHRDDLAFDDSIDRHGYHQMVTLLAPDERRVMKWNGNPFGLGDWGNPLEEEPGTIFTFPYWLGRYYGFLKGE